MFSEAELLGIDMSKLMAEMPSHPTQIKNRRQHEAKAKLYWDWIKIQNEDSSKFSSKKEYKFTDAQLRLVEQIIERKKSNGNR